MKKSIIIISVIIIGIIVVYPLKSKYTYASSIKNYVKITKDTPIYDENSNEIGYLMKGYVVEVTNYYSYYNLYEIIMDSKYYISKSNTERIMSDEKSMRYKNYVPFNFNVKTGTKTSLYKDDKVMIVLQKPFEFSVYRVVDGKYYVEYNNELFYVLDKDVTKYEIGDYKKARDIAVLAYHFIYDDNNCNQIICNRKEDVERQIKYLNDNNFLTLSMDEFEMFLNKEINIPIKSVLITVDDGWYGDNAKKIFTDNKIKASIFTITSLYYGKGFNTNYVEAHSHSDNLHTPGKCKGGQGSPLLCMNESFLLDDLNKSREKLGGSVYFAYPFYEYNGYAKEIVKKAGFHLAFKGGNTKANIDGDKLEIPRYTILKNTSLDEFIKIVNL